MVAELAKRIQTGGLVLMDVNPYVQQITIGLAFDGFAKPRRLK